MLERKLIVNKTDQSGARQKEEITLRAAQPEDAPGIHRLMREAYNALTDKSLFVCDEESFIRSQLTDSGCGVVACSAAGQIVGSFVLRFPHDAPDNLGRDIGLSPEELTKVVHMESAAVAPAYQGNGLQRRMLKFAEETIDTTRYSIALVTVSPDNPASYKSFERAGYRLVLTKEKYGGLPRRIYMKHLT